jgi:hypothetical protein
MHILFWGLIKVLNSTFCFDVWDRRFCFDVSVSTFLFWHFYFDVSISTFFRRFCFDVSVSTFLFRHLFDVSVSTFLFRNFFDALLSTILFRRFFDVWFSTFFSRQSKHGFWLLSVFVCLALIIYPQGSSTPAIKNFVNTRRRLSSSFMKQKIALMKFPPENFFHCE